MRNIQYRILTRLLNTLSLPSYVYAFERNRNIPEMAAVHVGKYCVVSLDIKDFFHTIKQNSLNAVFQDLGIGSLPSRTLSEVCTFKAYVPQGALTSPKLSNLITAVSFGPQIEGYCRSMGMDLTIYADDVTISFNNREINPKDVIQEVSGMIQSHGFRINTKKTKIMYHGIRQYVCGAVVNSKVNLIVGERKKLRAIVHNIVKNGIESEAAKSGVEPSKFLNTIRGRLNWYKQLNPELGQRLFEKLKVYLVHLKEQAQHEQEIKFMYEAYQQEIDRTIYEETPVEPAPF